jgi:hemerythrin-like metal-binding protein
MTDTDEGLDVGVASIDAQHHGLVAQVAVINQLVSAHAAPDRLKESYEKLQDLTFRHFRHEEELMAQAAFAGTAAHRLHHHGLLLILDRYYEGLKHDNPTDDPVAHLAFLREWLELHITSDDRALARHLNSLGIQ